MEMVISNQLKWMEMVKQPTKMDGNGDFQPIWAPPWSLTASFPWKVTGTQ